MKKVTKILAAMVLFLFMAGSAHAGFWVKDLKVTGIQQFKGVTTIIFENTAGKTISKKVYGDGSADTKKMITALAMMAYAEEDGVDTFMDANGILLFKMVK